MTSAAVNGSEHLILPTATATTPTPAEVPPIARAGEHPPQERRGATRSRVHLESRRRLRTDVPATVMLRRDLDVAAPPSSRRGHVLNLRVRKEHLAARLARALRLWPASRSGAGRAGSISRSIFMGHRPHRAEKAEKMVASYHCAATPQKSSSVAINRCNISLDLMLQPMLQQTSPRCARPSPSSSNATTSAGALRSWRIARHSTPARNTSYAMPHSANVCPRNRVRYSEGSTVTVGL